MADANINTTNGSPPPGAPVPGPVIDVEAVKNKIDAMSPQEIEARRREICESCKGDYEALSEESLHELSYIAMSLRKRSSGPPKEAKVAGAKKATKTVDDLF